MTRSVQLAKQAIGGLHVASPTPRIAEGDRALVVRVLLRLALSGAACAAGYLLLTLLSPAAHAAPSSPSDVTGTVRQVAESVAGAGKETHRAVGEGAHGTDDATSKRSASRPAPAPKHVRRAHTGHTPGKLRPRETPTKTPAPGRLRPEQTPAEPGQAHAAAHLPTAVVQLPGKVVGTLLGVLRTTIDSVPILGGLPAPGEVSSPPAVAMPIGPAPPSDTPADLAWCAPHAAAAAVLPPPAGMPAFARGSQAGFRFLTGAARFAKADALDRHDDRPGSPGPAAPGETTPQGAPSARSGGSDGQPPALLAVHGVLPPLMAHNITQPGHCSAAGRSPHVSAPPG